MNNKKHFYIMIIGCSIGLLIILGAYSIRNTITKANASYVEGNNSTQEDSPGFELGGNNQLGNSEPVRIPTELLAIAEVEDEIQYIDIDVNVEGIFPAVVVVQRDLETVWRINSTIEMEDSNIVFPYYYAQMTLIEGENPIYFYPEDDFEFFIADTAYFGYVKVLDDISQLDEVAIRLEVDEFDPTAQDYNFGFGGAPSCH